MSRVDPSTSNRRLQNTQFLTDADLPLYDDLCKRVLALADPDETTALPTPNEAGAWSKAYRLYCARKRRAETDRDPEATVAAQNNYLVEQEFNKYLACRMQLLELMAAKRIHQGDPVLEYVGLRREDLCEPTADDPNHGRYRLRGWDARFARISDALWRLQNMTPAEREAVPERMRTRRLATDIEAIVEELNALKNAFDEKFEWLDARLSAVESRMTNPKH